MALLDEQLTNPFDDPEARRRVVQYLAQRQGIAPPTPMPTEAPPPPPADLPPPPAAQAPGPDFAGAAAPLAEAQKADAMMRLFQNLGRTGAGYVKATTGIDLGPDPVPHRAADVMAQQKYGIEQLAAPAKIADVQAQARQRTALASKAEGDTAEAEAQRAALHGQDTPATRLLRYLAKKYAGDVDVSGAAGADIAPVLKLAEQGYAADQRGEALKVQLQDRQQAREDAREDRNTYRQESRADRAAALARTDQRLEQTRGEKDDQFLAKRVSSLGKELNAGLASSRSGLGTANNVVARGGRMMALLGQGKSVEELNQINPQWVNEMSAAMAALVQGNNAPALETIRTMTPNGKGMNIAWLTQWLTDNPQGAQQGAFLQKMVETIGREDKAARAQVVKSQLSSLASYPDVAQKAPEQHARLLRQHGLSEFFDENGEVRQDVLNALTRNELPEAGGAPAAAASTATAPGVRKFKRVDGKLVEVKP